eukprot:scaffold98553_cov63-Phaeocystis_antarctica.AAC.4
MRRAYGCRAPAEVPRRPRVGRAAARRRLVYDGLAAGCRLRAAVLLRLGALAGGHLPDAPPRARRLDGARHVVVQRGGHLVRRAGDAARRPDGAGGGGAPGDELEQQLVADAADGVHLAQRHVVQHAPRARGDAQQPESGEHEHGRLALLVRALPLPLPLPPPLGRALRRRRHQVAVQQRLLQVLAFFGREQHVLGERLADGKRRDPPLQPVQHPRRPHAPHARRVRRLVARALAARGARRVGARGGELQHARRGADGGAHQALADAEREARHAAGARALDRLGHDAHEPVRHALAQPRRALQRVAAAALGRGARLRAAHRAHGEGGERAVHAAQQAARDLARVLHGREERVLGEGGAARGHGLADVLGRADDGLGGEVEEVLDAGAERAHEADRVAEHFDLQHDAVDLLERGVDVVLADGLADLVGDAEEVVAEERVEAERRRVDVRDGQRAQLAPVVVGAEGEQHLDRVDLELVEVPHALRRAVPRQRDAALGGARLRRARPVVGLGDDAEREDLLAELLHLRRHDEVEQRLHEGRLERHVELEHAHRGVLPPVDRAARLLEVLDHRQVHERRQVLPVGPLAARPAGVGARDDRGHRRARLLAVDLEALQPQLGGRRLRRLHVVDGEPVEREVEQLLARRH